MELIIILSLVAAWIVSGYAADLYAMRKAWREAYPHIQNVLDYSYDTEREHYIETYGEESNNYLWLDDDLNLHLEQEDNNHIFKSYCYLQNRLTEEVKPFQTNDMKFVEESGI